MLRRWRVACSSSCACTMRLRLQHLSKKGCKERMRDCEEVMACPAPVMPVLSTPVPRARRRRVQAMQTPLSTLPDDQQQRAHHPKLAVASAAGNQGASSWPASARRQARGTSVVSAGQAAKRGAAQSCQQACSVGQRNARGMSKAKSAATNRSREHTASAAATEISNGASASSTSPCADDAHRGGSGVGSARLQVAMCVAKSRAACRTPFLNGAAPVCYGMPTAFAAPSRAAT